MPISLFTKEEIVTEIKAKMGGKSVTEFAAYLGISQPLLSQILSGVRTPGITLLKKFDLERFVGYRRKKENGSQG